MEQGDVGLGSVRHVTGEPWDHTTPPPPASDPASLDGAVGGLLPFSLLLARRLRSNDGGSSLRLPRSRGAMQVLFRMLLPHAWMNRFGTIFPCRATFAVDRAV
jgi:hypothetical protein